jgi:hypothetical protein
MGMGLLLSSPPPRHHPLRRLLVTTVLCVRTCVRVCVCARVSAVLRPKGMPGMGVCECVGWACGCRGDPEDLDALSGEVTAQGGCGLVRCLPCVSSLFWGEGGGGQGGEAGRVLPCVVIVACTGPTRPAAQCLTRRLRGLP